ncbi:hypothetical protein BS47DRAFT_1398616 [Hydnum rufescens UP504]|uniref:Uncharacterized protein n=1 Tax=Hydnum rufescens UP504 TaxID=1448309 RepID=A0A9P6AKA1_9AGAM|nr:hypothetical protein BS47DRAFT_1398616 [Hydnum rufescens UP504]
MALSFFHNESDFLRGGRHLGCRVLYGRTLGPKSSPLRVFAPTSQPSFKGVGRFPGSPRWFSFPQGPVTGPSSFPSRVQSSTRAALPAHGRGGDSANILGSLALTDTFTSSSRCVSFLLVVPWCIRMWVLSGELSPVRQAAPLPPGAATIHPTHTMNVLWPCTAPEEGFAPFRLPLSYEAGLRPRNVHGTEECRPEGPPTVSGGASSSPSYPFPPSAIPLGLFGPTTFLTASSQFFASRCGHDSSTFIMLLCFSALLVRCLSFLVREQWVHGPQVPLIFPFTITDTLELWLAELRLQGFSLGHPDFMGGLFCQPTMSDTRHRFLAVVGRGAFRRTGHHGPGSYEDHVPVFTSVRCSLAFGDVTTSA